MPPSFPSHTRGFSPLNNSRHRRQRRHMRFDACRTLLCDAQNQTVSRRAPRTTSALCLRGTFSLDGFHHRAEAVRLRYGHLGQDLYVPHHERTKEMQTFASSINRRRSGKAPPCTTGAPMGQGGERERSVRRMAATWCLPCGWVTSLSCACA